MNNYDELREKLKEAHKNARIALIIGEVEPSHGLDAICESAKIYAKAIDEALALLESEQGEQMRRDHEAMEKMRAYNDTTDAILDTQSENGENDDE